MRYSYFSGCLMFAHVEARLKDKLLGVLYTVRNKNKKKGTFILGSCLSICLSACLWRVSKLDNSVLGKGTGGGGVGSTFRPSCRLFPIFSRTDQ
jgi:hypothetical protein